MSFCGSVSAIITSLKNNARPKKKIAYNKKETNWKKVATKLKKFREKKAKPEQLEKIRNTLLSENKRDTYKILIVLANTLLIISWLSYWFFYI